MAKKPKYRKGERWGRNYIDRRDWKKENEKYVVRGEFLIDLDFAEQWDNEVEIMNRNKVGGQFVFPNSLIELQAVWNQWIGVRQVKGITRRLFSIGQLPGYNDFSTINRRIRQIDTTIQLPKVGFCSVSTDGTGIKMHHAGEYRQMKYKGKKRRWIKVVISANPMTKELLDVEVSLDGEGKSEPEIAEQHLNMLWSFGYAVDKFWGDGAFDTISLFNLLEEHGTESAIPPRDNASGNANGSMRRAREVAEYQLQPWDAWARNKQYGKRWLGTEGMISAVKCIFGEDTKAKNAENACLEAERKFWAYDKMQKYAAT